MVSLTGIWIMAGRPEGRRPSDYKRTADVKRHLAICPEEWHVEGRGVKAVTSASDLLAIGYRAYVITAKRTTGAKAKAAPTGTGTGTGTGGYTAEDMKRAYESGKMDGWDEGNAVGMDAGYRYGYERGMREGSQGKFGKLDEVHSYINSAARGRKAFAMRFHPDRQGNTRQATDNMSFINNFFDDLEKIFDRAA